METQLSKQEIIRNGTEFKMEHIVERYMKDFDLPLEVAKEHEKEIKRYLIMCAINKDREYGMRGQVDELWHMFIFFTKDYFAFCKALGTKYIHHVPNTSMSKPKKSSYFNTLEDYREIFGEEPPKHIWPPIKNPTNELDPANLDVCSTSCSKCSGGGSGCGSGCSGCDKCSN